MKRFQKDHDLLRKYSDNIDLLAKGYATKVPKVELENPQQPLWYLPHHPVYNSNRQTRSESYLTVLQNIKYHR